MAKFIFKMQSLLNIKIQMEDNMKNELGKATMKLELEKEKLYKLENEKEELIANLNSKTGSGITVSKIKEYNSYLSLLNEKMNHQKDNILYAKSMVDKCRQQLIKVMQEKEVLEKLKEKKLQEFLSEQAKAEQKIIDEVVSFKYTNIEIEN